MPKYEVVNSHGEVLRKYDLIRHYTGKWVEFWGVTQDGKFIIYGEGDTIPETQPASKFGLEILCVQGEG